MLQLYVNAHSSRLVKNVKIGAQQLHCRVSKRQCLWWVFCLFTGSPQPFFVLSCRVLWKLHPGFPETLCPASRHPLFQQSRAVCVVFHLLFLLSRPCLSGVPLQSTHQSPRFPQLLVAVRLTIPSLFPYVMYRGPLSASLHLSHLMGICFPTRTTSICLFVGMFQFPFLQPECACSQSKHHSGGVHVSICSHYHSFMASLHPDRHYPCFFFIFILSN